MDTKRLEKRLKEIEEFIKEIRHESSIAFSDNPSLHRASLITTKCGLIIMAVDRIRAEQNEA